MTHDLVERLQKPWDGTPGSRRRRDEERAEAADRIEKLECENAALRAEKDEIRKAIIEEAAQIAEECDIAMSLIVGGPDGASIARRQIAAAIRNMGDLK